MVRWGPLPPVDGLPGTDRGPWQPVLLLAPDGRAGYSAPAGEPSGWYWLEALTWSYYVGEPLIWRRVRADGDKLEGFNEGEEILEDMFPRFFLAPQ